MLLTSISLQIDRLLDMTKKAVTCMVMNMTNDNFDPDLKNTLATATREKTLPLDCQACTHEPFLAVHHEQGWAWF